MDFDELSDRAVRAARTRAGQSDRPPIADVAQSQRWRAVVALGMGFVVVLVGVALATLLPTGGSGPDVASTVSPPVIATTTTAAVTTTAEPPPVPSSIVPAEPPASFAGAVWSIAQNPHWYRGNSDLMPNLGWDSVTLATFPLRPGGTMCAHMPENALRDLGPEDSLVTAFFSGGAGSDAAPWPADGFDDGTFPVASGTTDAHECAERPELEVHWGYWNNSDEGIYLLVVFGSDVSAEVRATTWSMTSSLKSVDPGDGGRNCVVTVPTPPGLAVPDTHPAAPPAGLWYGIPELWTVLEVDGSYGPRKSVWWSANFPGGQRESSPAISVTWHRLDAEVPDLATSGGTNANAVGYNWFMISGIDPDGGGCWEITAQYKGASLSYVARIQQQ